MGLLYTLPEGYAADYLAKHTGAARRCARILGPLETKEDAVRWARLAFRINSVEPVLATLLIVIEGLEPWMVWVNKTGMIAQIILHAERADRDKETALFLALLEHRDRRVREGAIMLLGRVGTEAAIPPLVNIMHAGGGHSFAAFSTLCDIGDESVVPLLEKEAVEGGYLKRKCMGRMLAGRQRRQITEQKEPGQK